MSVVFGERAARNILLTSYPFRPSVPANLTADTRQAQNLSLTSVCLQKEFMRSKRDKRGIDEACDTAYMPTLRV